MLLQVLGNVVLILAIIIFNVVCMSKTRTLYVQKPETKIETKIETTESNETSIEETSKEYTPEPGRWVCKNCNRELEIGQSCHYCGNTYEKQTGSHEKETEEESKNNEQVTNAVSTQSDTNDSKDIIDLQVEKSVLTQEEKYEISNFRQAMIIENKINFNKDTGKVVESQKEDKEIAKIESTTSKLRNMEEPITSTIAKAIQNGTLYEDKFCKIDIKGRDTLLIGDSRAVGIANSDINADVIAFSGIYDNELVNLLNMSVNRYNKIIIVASINDVIRDYIGNKGISQTTIQGISDIVTASNKHLNPGGTTYYVRNTLGYKYVFLRDTLNQLNDNLKLNSGGVWTVLEPEYTIENSKSTDGLHFANLTEYQNFYVSILDAIEKMEKRG